ncbi:hypothetical protein [Bradyrhizobium sp. USDA 10063]
MKTITIIEDDERARSIYVRPDGDVTVFDRDRKFRFKIDIAAAKTTWQILARVAPLIANAESVRVKIDDLADRCRTGWRPGYPDEIDPDIPQRTLRRARFGIDLIRYPDYDDFYSPATILMGDDENGQFQVTTEILWIDAGCEWAVCEDCFWWTPPDDRESHGD